jgi:hypothetical protein
VVGAVDAEGRQKSLVAESRGWRGSIVGWGCRGAGCMVGGCDGDGREEEDAMGGGCWEGGCDGWKSLRELK